MTIHTIQTNPDRFQHTMDGAWYYYVARDRDYRVGDTLELQEVDPETNAPTGRTLQKVIRDIEDSRRGIRPGFLALFFVPMLKSNFPIVDTAT